MVLYDYSYAYERIGRFCETLLPSKGAADSVSNTTLIGRTMGCPISLYLLVLVSGRSTFG